MRIYDETCRESLNEDDAALHSTRLKLKYCSKRNITQNLHEIEGQVNMQAAYPLVRCNSPSHRVLYRSLEASKRDRAPRESEYSM